jgi:transcriptional regulator GlxA family with amidase domain
MTKVHFYVQDTLADWEFGYVTSELNTGRFFREPGHRLPVTTVGATTSPVRTMGGVALTPELTVDQVRPEPAQKPVLDKAREFLAAGVPVAAICGATLGLAEAGILDDRAHTSNDLQALKHVPAYRGEHHYVDAPAVTGGDLITASGEAPLDFARHVLARLDVLSPDALDAWYGLYSTHDPEYFVKLMDAVPKRG